MSLELNKKLELALRLADAATPGPWTPGRMDMQSYDENGAPHGSVYWDDPDGEWHLGHRLPGVVARTTDPERNHADALFIAVARTLVPELVAEVTRLRRALAIFMHDSDNKPRRDALNAWADCHGFASWAEVEELAK